MPDVKPFDFGRLPKISSKDARLLSALQNFLPRIGFSDELGRAVRRLIAKELGPSFTLRSDRISTVSLPSVLTTLPRQGVYLVFGMTPLEEKAFLELDLFLAHVAIDKLLGGGGEPLTMVRPLTEIEEGVLSYLFLKVLAEIFERCGRSARVHFRLEGFRSSSEELASLVSASPGGETGVLIVYRLTVGDRSGYARLILPSPFVRKAFLEPTEGAAISGGMSERELHYYSARLFNLGFLETELWAEVGRSTLKGRELQGLEPGDVVLLEETDLQLQGGRLTGSLPLRVGRGERGAFRGEVVEDSPIRLQLAGMELEHPVGGPSL